jgi:hypothetical protein
MEIPTIKNNVFSQEDFHKIKNHFKKNKMLENKRYDYYGSKRIDSYEDKLLYEVLNSFLDKAKTWFKEDDLVPTYSVFSEYSGASAMLDKHKDSGPCTYTIDICIYSNIDWPLIIENKEYLFSENEAVIFYANDQEHWRTEFPDKESGIVGMMFLHYAKPSHKWFTYDKRTQKLIKERFKAI